MTPYSPTIRNSVNWRDYDIIERELPELWRKCYPRRYDETPKAQYDSPKAVGRALMDAVLGYYRSYNLAKGAAGQTEQAEAVWSAQMIRFGVPQYYLGHDLSVALSRTTPSQTLDCLEIKLPFPAAAFMLPAGILSHPEYGDVAFVAYARMIGGTEVDLPHPNPESKHTLIAPHGKSAFTVFVRTVSGITLHWQYNPEVRMVDLRDSAGMEEMQKRYSHSTTEWPKEFHDFTETDIQIMINAIKLVFNVVLFITAKPEMVEGAKLLKRVRKGPGPVIEYWRPHIIGRSYKLRYERHEPTGAHHASPIGHWVSGFWREQAYGPQHSLRKEMWIEPFWRGGNV